MRSPRGQVSPVFSKWVNRAVEWVRNIFYQWPDPRKGRYATSEEQATSSPDKDGETQGPISEVTEAPPETLEIDMGFGVLLVTTGALAGAGLGLSRVRIPYQERDLFERIGAAENVSPDLLHAIAWQESNINAAAISPANRNLSRDYGMMQINERNFALLGLSQLTALNAERNVRAAADLIQRIQSAGVKDAADILSIYNAGDARFKPFGSGPRLRAGKYVNQVYVTSSLGKMTLIRLANFVPLLRTVPA